MPVACNRVTTIVRTLSRWSDYVARGSGAIARYAAAWLSDVDLRLLQPRRRHGDDGTVEGDVGEVLGDHLDR